MPVFAVDEVEILESVDRDVALELGVISAVDSLVFGADGVGLAGVVVAELRRRSSMACWVCRSPAMSLRPLMRSVRVVWSLSRLMVWMLPSWSKARSSRALEAE
jgi:hypothetical protein